MVAIAFHNYPPAGCQEHPAVLMKECGKRWRFRKTHEMNRRDGLKSHPITKINNGAKHRAHCPKCHSRCPSCREQAARNR